MFQKFLNSGEKKLKFLLYLVLVVIVMTMLIYIDLSYQRRNVYDSEQVLYQLGKTYEFKIKSELDRYYSILDLLAVGFTKIVTDKNFTEESKVFLQNLIEKNERVYSIGFMFKTNVNPENETLLSLSDSIMDNFVAFSRNKSGIVESTNLGELENLQLKVEIEKTIVKEQTRILSPLVIQSEGNDVSVIPVVSAVYKGRQLVGYLVLMFSIDWFGEEFDLSNTPYEAFVSSGNGKLISIKEKKVFLTENIKKVCLTCNDLLSDKGSRYNSQLTSGYLTLCQPIDINGGLGKWDVCIRSHESDLEGHLVDRIVIWVIGFVLLGLGIFLIHIFVNRVEKPWEEVLQLADGISTGQYYSLQNNKNSDVRDANAVKIKASLDNIVKSLETLTSISKASGAGDFSGPVSLPGFKNGIVAGVNTLVNQLKETKEKLARYEIETKRINHFIEGIDKISDVLKLYHKDIHELSDQVIRTLVDIMNIEMGAVFLLKNEGNDSFLDLEVSYAYNESKYHKRRFNLGESIVGSCASEKRTVHLKKVPDDYLKIISGLGQTSPKSLLIIPLVFEDEVLGVLELGALNEFEQHVIDFAEKAAETIANTLSLAENNIKNSILLEKNQVQTKDLEESDRKMKEALAELSEMQSKTAKSESEVRAKLEAMNHTLMMVEYTTEGILLDANYKFLNTMQYSLDEVEGINVLELLKEEDREELQKVINTVKSGNYYEAIMRRHTKTGQEKWFMATYTPVFDDDGNVKNILFFGVDITKMKTT